MYVFVREIRKEELILLGIQPNQYASKNRLYRNYCPRCFIIHPSKLFVGLFLGFHVSPVEDREKYAVHIFSLNTFKVKWVTSTN